MAEHDPLEYALNRMEAAARSADPFKAGYGPARDELLAGIRDLRRRAEMCETWHVRYEAQKAAHELSEKAAQAAETEARRLRRALLIARPYVAAVHGQLTPAVGTHNAVWPDLVGIDAALAAGEKEVERG